MSKFYNNQLFYGIEDGQIIECRLVKYDETKHILYLRDSSGRAYKCSEYRLDRELFTLKFKAEQHLGIHKPKSNSYSPRPTMPESSASFDWSGSGIHVDHGYGKGGKSIMDDYLGKRPLQKDEN